MKKALFLFLILSARISFADSDLSVADRQAHEIKQNALASAVACVKYRIRCPEGHQKHEADVMYNLLMQKARSVIGDSKSTFAQREEAQIIIDCATAFQLKYLRSLAGHRPDGMMVESRQVLGD